MPSAHLLSRRHLLQAGALALPGLSLSQLLAGEAAQPAPVRRKAAKSCILFFMEGGPPHLDMWDMKPDAPDNIRGEFKPIRSSAVDLHVCDHLPLLSKQMHHVALVRSVHHKVFDHNAGAYYCLTGRTPVKPGGQLIVGPNADNFPPYGAVLSKLRPSDNVMPSFVHLAEIMVNNGSDLPGQRAGFMGTNHNPLVLGDVSVKNYRAPGLQLPKDVSLSRMDRRFKLLSELHRQDGRGLPQAKSLNHFQEKALELLCSPHVRQAFDVSLEAPKIRDRYGLRDRKKNVEARKFGGLPHLGQCMLMARRLAEAGTRLITVGSGRRLCQAWDTHRDHFPLLKMSLLPYTDRALSALIEDLAQRGQLDETLVVAMGEFGRTPRMGQVTSNAGAAKNGRDHWPHCYSVLFAGGGVTGGATYGKSDKHAAFPEDNPVTPEDIAATIYWAMGLDPERLIYDRLNRPNPVALGRPITAIFS